MLKKIYVNINIYKYMTSISNIYLDKLDDIVNEHNNVYHKTIKLKSIDFKTSTYFDLKL